MKDKASDSIMIHVCVGNYTLCTLYVKINVYRLADKAYMIPI